MTEKYYKTLLQLSEDHKFPFDVISNSGVKLTIVAITPALEAIGWNLDTGNSANLEIHQAKWKRVIPITLLFEILVLDDGCYKVEPYLFQSLDVANKHCTDVGVDFVRVLREVEVTRNTVV